MVVFKGRGGGREGEGVLHIINSENLCIFFHFYSINFLLMWKKIHNMFHGLQYFYSVWNINPYIGNWESKNKWIHKIESLHDFKGKNDFLSGTKLIRNLLFLKKMFTFLKKFRLILYLKHRLERSSLWVSNLSQNL